MIGSARLPTPRAAGIPVIYTRVDLADRYVELHPNNRPLAPLMRAGVLTSSDPDGVIHDRVTPHEGDAVIVKKRQSALTGSSLEVILRSQQVPHLVMTGLTTSGVVLPTVRQAAVLDYQITVLADGCADPDAEVHRVLLDEVFPAQADVLTVDEWVSKLGTTADRRWPEGRARAGRRGARARVPVQEDHQWREAAVQTWDLIGKWQS